MTYRRVIALCALVAVHGSCAGSPTSPSVVTDARPAVAAARPVDAAPAVISPDARIFSFIDVLTPPVSWYTSASRFEFNPDGTFVLQYPHGAYRGRYREVDGGVQFDWDGSSAAGPWGATGSIDHDRLTVRYNLTMQLSDFEDAVYVRQQ